MEEELKIIDSIDWQWFMTVGEVETERWVNGREGVLKEEKMSSKGEGLMNKWMNGWKNKWRQAGNEGDFKDNRRGTQILSQSAFESQTHTNITAPPHSLPNAHVTSNLWARRIRHSTPHHITSHHITSHHNITCIITTHPIPSHPIPYYDITLQYITFSFTPFHSI